MNLRQLEAFRATMRRGSITAAANLFAQVLIEQLVDDRVII
jgi:hypothetical protein